MSLYADLHSHSTASDGCDRPARVVERAAAAGLAVLALTDHDTLDGIPEAAEAAARLGITLVPGAELTCYENGREVNILGYGLRVDDDALAGHCRRFIAARQARAREIGDRLAALGMPVDMDAIMAKCDGGVVGRPHVAQALVDAGYVEDTREAFDLYLGNGKPAEVPKLQVTVDECLDVIHQAGGIAVLAHPGIWDQFELAGRLKARGLDGVEVWHSAHTPEMVERAQIVADDHGLLKTGGSDCHGAKVGKGELMGGWGMTRQAWRRVAEHLGLPA
jgi:predicted metal-dependent phosphoesterase TrpH